jgi:shikimate kinase
MINFSEFNSPLQEGVNDPAIFKAIFVAGGAGSGKTFIADKTAFASMGFKLINSDRHFEKGLAKAQLEMTPENIYSDEGQAVRKRSKQTSGKELQLAIDGRLGLLVDGTGKDYSKIKKQVDGLNAIGYETALLFVNTDLDTAIQRNRERRRRLPDDVVALMWKEVQNNLGKFSQLFGRHMYIIDNSESSDWSSASTSVYKRVREWAKQIPVNPAAKAWIDHARKNK